MLVRTGRQISDYLETEVHDDLSARVHVYRCAVDVYRYTHAEAQYAAMAFSLAARAGRIFRLDGFVFALNPTQES